MSSANTITGVMFQGMFLEKDKFISAFKTFYDQQFEALKSDLQTTIIAPIENEVKNIDQTWMNTKFYTGWVVKNPPNKLVEQIFTNWDKIEQTYFTNPIVTLQALFSSDNGQSYSFTDKLEIENSIVQQFKGQIKIKKSMFKDILSGIQSDANKQKLQQLFNTHYAELLSALNEPLTRRQAAMIHRKTAYQNKTYEHWTGQTPNNIFYSRSEQYGNRMDGFLNHIAKRDTELYYLLYSDLSTEQAITTLNNFHFSHGFNNFSELSTLIADSLNKISWYTGGDVIIVNDHGQVVFNIQVKSSINSEGKWKIPLSSLYTFVRQLTSTTNSQEAAELAFQYLQTTAIKDASKIDESVKKTAIDLVKSQFSKQTK